MIIGNALGIMNQMPGIRSSTPGLLGGPQQQGLLGPMQRGYGTQNLMQQYLQNLFMRRYNPPALQQQPGMVSSQMGPGGMQYRAPQRPQAPNPTQQQQLASPFMPFEQWRMHVGQYLPSGGSYQEWQQSGG